MQNSFNEKKKKKNLKKLNIKLKATTKAMI